MCGKRSLFWFLFSLCLFFPVASRAEDMTHILIRTIEANDIPAIKAALGMKPNLDPECPPHGICKPLAIAAMKGNLEAVKLLIEAGADPDGANAYGDTAFITALNFEGKNQTETDKVVREIQMYLLGHGADPNRPNQFGKTPMFWAAYTEDIEMLDLGLKNGGDVDFADQKVEGVTVLMDAAYNGKMKSVEWLLAHGADKKLRSTKNKTAYDYAVQAKHSEIAGLLKE